MTSLEFHARPTLAGSVRLQLDPVEGQPVLLYPEGFLSLNETSHDVLKLCDGRRTTHEILDLLAAEYDATPDELAADVDTLLGQLRERNFLTFEP